MTGDELRARQTPLKQRYRDDPASATATLEARGVLDFDRIACRLEGDRSNRPAGLHPLAGGDGSCACSAEMLLESLVGCAGTTLCAVATAMGLPVTAGTITASGRLDFRGTLGVDRATPVGFTEIRLEFHLETTAAPEQVDKLIQLTERYCVVFQTLRSPPQIIVATA